MMTVNKGILLHPDFMNGFAYELCEALEALIDSEFEKGDETDFDFIDECAQAINAIRSGDTAQILPLISRRDFFKKIGVKTDRKIQIFVAACAAVALIFTAATQIEVRENISIVQALSGIVSDYFTDRKQIEVTTTQPATTREKEASIISICVETTPEFRSEYNVGEKFSTEGLRVFAEYENGERIIINPENYSVDVTDSFGAKAGYETVTVKVGNFKQTIEVRVIESLSTKKLNSIYAVFPDSFDFTADDLNDIDLDEMQVYAVYSDGGEKELVGKEYSVDYEYRRKLFKNSVKVTVTHEGCSCSFVINEK